MDIQTDAHTHAHEWYIAYEYCRRYARINKPKWWKNREIPSGYKFCVSFNIIHCWYIDRYQFQCCAPHTVPLHNAYLRRTDFFVVAVAGDDKNDIIIIAVLGYYLSRYRNLWLISFVKSNKWINFARLTTMIALFSEHTQWKPPWIIPTVGSDWYNFLPVTITYSMRWHRGKDENFLFAWNRINFLSFTHFDSFIVPVFLLAFFNNITITIHNICLHLLALFTPASVWPNN